MELLTHLFFSAIPFLIVITILVFVHEYGHYITAIKNGVKVDVFSIGFGPEIFGWTNAQGMRWKFSAIPLGGYVKLADEDQQFKDNIDQVPDAALQNGSLVSKSVGARAAIAFAGPLANFIYAIVVLTGLYATVGQRVPQPGAVIGHVSQGSAGEAAGLKAGDFILIVNDQDINATHEFTTLIRRHGDKMMHILVRSQDSNTHRIVHAKPAIKQGMGQLGIDVKAPYKHHPHNLLASIYYATVDTFKSCKQMLIGIGHMLTGQQSVSGLSGPLGIASMTGQVAKQGIVELLFLSTLLSINLGLLNLLPIPVLDGGHLVLYGLEALRGKPVSEKAQDIIFKVGFGIMASLFAFTFWNDLQGLKWVQAIKSFVINL